jgi:CDP-diglyceride synthetase
VLVIAVVAITAHDARGGAVRASPAVGAVLGSIALVEYARMTALRATAAGRAAVVAGIAALSWRTVADVVTAVPPPAGAFIAFAGLACAAPVVAAVVAGRARPVGPADARDAAAGVLGVAIVVLPVLALVEIGYLVPAGGFSPRTCGLFSSPGREITEETVGPWLLLVTILVSKLNDIGGYLVGSLVGRRSLAPGISPNKSIEGAVAGLALGVAGSLAAFVWLCPVAGLLSVPLAATFGLVVSVAAQLGDLFESLIKRSCGVKDSAALIPAFGGIFDLLDSFILAAPAGYTLLWWWKS